MPAPSTVEIWDGKDTRLSAGVRFAGEERAARSSSCTDALERAFRAVVRYSTRRRGVLAPSPRACGDRRVSGSSGGRWPAPFPVRTGALPPLSGTGHWSSGCPLPLPCPCAHEALPGGCVRLLPPPAAPVGANCRASLTRSLPARAAGPRRRTARGIWSRTTAPRGCVCHLGILLV